ncbi:MAG: hypothetical protein H7Y88_04115, partial [Phycisphaerales bacterium]|nr:hypothetical protein [Phycisphaerales bacterium]
MNLGLLVIILGLLVAIPLGVVAVIYLIVPAFKAIAWVVRQIARFVFGTVSDALRLVGAIITSVVFIPLTIGSIVIGRWSASAHYGRALQGELKAMGASVYRLVIGHPARLLCLHSLTEGIEQRIPRAIAAAPATDRPRGRTNQFDGYKIVGSLAGGGSGGRLYVAEPSHAKLAAFSRSGAGPVERVVIKSFSLNDGSSLPQIVRESRSLDAAKRLGLILEHELEPDRFHYVMRYVPGDSLSLVTQRLHATTGGAGLGGGELSQVLEFQGDLLRTLCHYHTGGLWHKDVKPDNIIVCNGQAHLVDFGLVSHLRSAMTLTTHGTEYFRDPEMVRLALKGVKVHEVDGAKFDVYAAGAVLYSMIENSFPAHGGLSQITRRCPEALRWVVRRAMTDYDKRYQSAADMLADIDAIGSSKDAFALRLADLPSMRGADADSAGTGAADHPEHNHAYGPVASVHAAAWAPSVSPVAAHASAVGAASINESAAGTDGRFAGSPVPPTPAAEGAKPSRQRPVLRVNCWWSGRYQPAPGKNAYTAAGP